MQSLLSLCKFYQAFIDTVGYIFSYTDEIQHSMENSEQFRTESEGTFFSSFVPCFGVLVNFLFLSQMVFCCRGCQHVKRVSSEAATQADRLGSSLLLLCCTSDLPTSHWKLKHTRSQMANSLVTISLLSDDSSCRIFHGCACSSNKTAGNNASTLRH